MDGGVEVAQINWKNKTPDVTPSLTEAEYMMFAIAELDAQRELDKTENEMAIAELVEALMGGVV